MCGICGLIPFKKGKVTPDALLSEMMVLLIANEKRGEDATGVAVGGDAPKIIKGNVKATEFVTSEHFLSLFADMEHPPPMIGHCRKSTGGSPSDNENNHPLYVGDFVVIHNGSVKNKPREEDVKGKVDSLFFPWVLNKMEQESGEVTNRHIRKLVETVDGSFALCWFNTKNPNTFYLIRDKVDGRKVYFTVTDDYFKFTQIQEDGMDELAPYDLVEINAETGEVKLYPLAIGVVPTVVLELIEALQIPESVRESGNADDVKKFILQELEGGCVDIGADSRMAAIE